MSFNQSISNKKAAPRFELGVKALQAPALPLGHAAVPYLSYKTQGTVSS